MQHRLELPDNALILVPIDFSDCSRAALKWSARLHERTGARVDVIHAWQIPSTVYTGVQKSEKARSQLATGLRREAEASLDAFADAVTDSDNIRLKRFVQGDPAATILDLSKSDDYDLIVMGARGEGNTQGEYGSVTKQVAANASCPVMAVDVQRSTDSSSELRPN
jgi:nucleotide-binding universal stress UspA family protein